MAVWDPGTRLWTETLRKAAAHGLAPVDPDDPDIPDEPGDEWQLVIPGVNIGVFMPGVWRRGVFAVDGYADGGAPPPEGGSGQAGGQIIVPGVDRGVFMPGVFVRGVWQVDAYSTDPGEPGEPGDGRTVGAAGISLGGQIHDSLISPKIKPGSRAYLRRMLEIKAVVDALEGPVEPGDPDVIPGVDRGVWTPGVWQRGVWQTDRSVGG